MADVGAVAQIVLKDCPKCGGTGQIVGYGDCGQEIVELCSCQSK